PDPYRPRRRLRRRRAARVDVTAQAGAAPRRRTTLAVQVTALCVLVAVVAVGIAAVLAGRLVASTARDVLASTLSAQADVLEGQVADAGAGGRLGVRRLASVLQSQGV